MHSESSIVSQTTGGATVHVPATQTHGAAQASPEHAMQSESVSQGRVSGAAPWQLQA
jgi:hypothetical protein